MSEIISTKKEPFKPIPYETCLMTNLCECMAIAIRKGDEKAESYYSRKIKEEWDKVKKH